jgi:hypothetical protein
MRKHCLQFGLMTFALVVVFALCAPVLPAQNNMSGQNSMGAQNNMSEVAAKLQKMSAALQLSPQQKQQIKPVLMDEAPKLKALKADTSLGPMQKAMKMRQIGEDTDAKLKPILTAEQYEKWEQMRTQERKQMMEGAAGR